MLEKGYSVEVLSSDYNHRDKKEYKNSRENLTLLHVPRYKRNLSLARLYSHFIFSKKVVKFMKSRKYDLVYVVVPPNILVKEISKLKKKLGFKLIYDVFDMWPESLPSNSLNKITSYPLGKWGQLRDSYLDQSDHIITECRLFNDMIKSKVPHACITTLYISKDAGDASVFTGEFSKLNLCYLGSINNIVDLDLIIELVSLILKVKPVVFHIIGNGENQSLLVDSLKESGVEVKFHGEIYDDVRKQEIYSKCHYGINLMKESVCVGLTMKSIDYFQSGLPLINNIPYDTSEFVNNYQCGFNVHELGLHETVNVICRLDNKDYLKMRKGTRKVYENNFSPEIFKDKIESIMKSISKRDIQ